MCSVIYIFTFNVSSVTWKNKNSKIHCMCGGGRAQHGNGLTRNLNVKNVRNKLSYMNATSQWQLSGYGVKILNKDAKIHVFPMVLMDEMQILIPKTIEDDAKKLVTKLCT